MKAMIAMSAIVMMIAGNSCSKADGDAPGVLESLYRTYRDGSIDECRLQGRLVYGAGANAYDAGAAIFDSSGRKIATCNYAWGPVDSLCKQVQSCVTVYRCRNHINGQPFVDKYGLSN